MIDKILKLDISSSFEEMPKLKDDYKTKDYWALPENVRNAIDRAKEKQQQSDFFYRLETLNEKIQVFT